VTLSLCTCNWQLASPFSLLLLTPFGLCAALLNTGLPYPQVAHTSTFNGHVTPIRYLYTGDKKWLVRQAVSLNEGSDHSPATPTVALAAGRPTNRFRRSCLCLQPSLTSG
jgi:hypothetical protein